MKNKTASLFKVLTVGVALLAIITIASSPSSNINAIPISTPAQIKLINLLNLSDFVFLTQSLMVEDAKEFIDELKVDIAEDSTPASSNPFNPMGK